MAGSVTVGRRGARVVLSNNALGKTVGFDWESGLKIGRWIAHKARGVRTPEREDHGNLAVRRLGEDLLIEDNGHLLFCLPCAVAIEVGHAMIRHSHLIEEEAVAEDIAFDGALLQRRGIRLGFTDNPAIKQMQGVMAAHDPTLRKAMSSSRLLQVQVGRPGVYLGPPPTEEKHDG